MVIAMCGQKVVDRKTTEEQMEMLELKETVDRLATANGVRWCGRVLRRDECFEGCSGSLSEWQNKARTTEEDLEEVGEGDRSLI